MNGVRVKKKPSRTTLPIYHYLSFPDRERYDRYGLYRVPTVAGWRTAHALA